MIFLLLRFQPIIVIRYAIGGHIRYQKGQSIDIFICSFSSNTQENFKFSVYPFSWWSEQNSYYKLVVFLFCFFQI